MREKRTIVVVMLLATIVVMGARALNASLVPKTENEIPVFSGAVRDMNKEAAVKDEMGLGNNPSLRSAAFKVYKTSASPEEVFAFYLQKIGGKENLSFEDPAGIKPGAVSQVRYEIECYTDVDFEDYSNEEARHPGMWMKQSLAKNRKPHMPGKWIKEARFDWMKKETNNDLTTFFLIIHDDSFEFSPDKYATSSQIEVQVATAKSEEAMREETNEDMERKTATMSNSFKSKPPTEKDLGVPLYPGAKFDANNSAGMSAGNDYAVYIYLTNDQPLNVANFYEQRLKIKPVSMGSNQYMIPLKGKMPMPDEGISIQPNIMFGGGAKTVISIQKMARGKE
jgi:hypothetical protein